MADRDDEKVELAAVPSNEHDKEPGDEKVVNITVTAEEDEGPRFECPKIDFSHINCKSLLDMTDDVNLVSTIHYLFFYSIYLFQFITITVFVGDTAWFDAEYCKDRVDEDRGISDDVILFTDDGDILPMTTSNFNEKSECENDDSLCYWTEWNNNDGIASDYCASTPGFTAYQISLLFYYLLYLLLWEVLSLLSSIVTVVNFDRISKKPPSNKKNSYVTPGGPLGGWDGNDNKGNHRPKLDNSNNDDDVLLTSESASNFNNNNSNSSKNNNNNYISPGGPSFGFGNTAGGPGGPGDMVTAGGPGSGDMVTAGGDIDGVDAEFVTPGMGGLMGGYDPEDYDWYYGGSYSTKDDNEGKIGVNNYPFRTRYIWSYNIFLPIKWIVLISLDKCKKFDTFKYSLLSSLSIDKINIGLEIGIKVVLNCAFAGWWIGISNQVDTITILVFVTSGLLAIQSIIEIFVLKALEFKVYILSSDD